MPMKTHEFVKLSPGDLIRPAGGGEVLMVTGNYGGRVTAVKTVDMTNADEWELVSKASYRKRGGEIDAEKERQVANLGLAVGESR